MGSLHRVIQDFVRPMIRIFGQGLDWLGVAAKLICHNNPGRTELIDQFLQKSLCSLCIPAWLDKNIKHVPICIDSPPQPMLFASDCDHNLKQPPGGRANVMS